MYCCHRERSWECLWCTGLWGNQGVPGPLSKRPDPTRHPDQTGLTQQPGKPAPLSSCPGAAPGRVRSITWCPDPLAATLTPSQHAQQKDSKTRPPGRHSFRNSQSRQRRPGDRRSGEELALGHWPWGRLVLTGGTGLQPNISGFKSVPIYQPRGRGTDLTSPSRDSFICETRVTETQPPQGPHERTEHVC